MRCLAPLLTSAALLALGALSPAALADHHEKDDAKASDGFTVLFDGKTLDGWEQRNGKATYKVEEVDGKPAIVGRTAEGSPNSFLCTKKTYGDFVLEFEVKLPTKNLNSGVQVRSSSKGDTKDGRVNGPQVEIESSPGDAGYVYGEAMGGGWLDPEDQHTNKDAFKNDAWNTFRVEAKGDSIHTFINGEAVSTLKNERVPAKGFIGLQVHSYGGPHPGVVMWRNIRIKPLDK
ncbi:3-keto-disaccharide hydrolase [Alienimonas californiensis]|uniref:3-keto-alpha-glucoside-1,2-lyase/3-keto-2-hydroxy-glucal hydratase domain-containing protein n=1 Tax=Alienimonas californiensis TaxID=2527989 RepID=A0A517P3J2_9PLAN|nr:DUF1080 domain-containing protein [Alienimonas californiensis]QDT13942.1 hypothetical protein CA12_00100 [Alienimonas californiensis]